MNGSAASAAGLGGERPGYRPVTPNSRWVLGFRSLSLSLFVEGYIYPPLLDVGVIGGIGTKGE